MVNFAGEWRWEMFQQYLPASTLLRIASITVMTRGNYCDSVGWNATTDKSFSVSSAYRFRCTQVDGARLAKLDSLECEFFAAPPDELIDLVQTDMSEAALG
ncbi:hypothetical protein V6N13_094950 [Hibiscus sabdariffa]